MFAVTIQNEPINLTEYADEIAGNRRTHVISFHDYLAEQVNLLEVDEDEEAGLDRFMIEEHKEP